MMLRNKSVLFIMVPCIIPLVWSSFECQTDSDCNTGYCCSKIPRILAVSKRQGPDSTIHLPPDWFVSSSCKPYIKANAPCAYVMKINGDCGCEPQTHCKYLPSTNTLLTAPTANKRDMPFGNPNAYLCTHE